MKYITLVFFMVIIPMLSQAQVGVNTDGSSPDPNTILDVKSESKGVVFPRMNYTQKEALVDSPGVLVYQRDNVSNETEGYYYNDGTKWIQMGKEFLGFSAAKSFSTDITLGLTESPVVFDSAIYNYGSNYDQSTGIYTVPEDGIYQVSIGLNFVLTNVDTDEGFNLFLEKNGSTEVFRYTWRLHSGTNSNMLNSTYINRTVQFQQGDQIYVEITTIQSVATGIEQIRFYGASGLGQSYFEIRRIN